MERMNNSIAISREPSRVMRAKDPDTAIPSGASVRKIRGVYLSPRKKRHYYAGNIGSRGRL